MIIFRQPNSTEMTTAPMFGQQKVELGDKSEIKILRRATVANLDYYYIAAKLHQFTFDGGR